MTRAEVYFRAAARASTPEARRAVLEEFTIDPWANHATLERIGREARVAVCELIGRQP